MDVKAAASSQASKNRKKRRKRKRGGGGRGEESQKNEKTDDMSTRCIPIPVPIKDAYNPNEANKRRKKRHAKPLNGLTLAISTMDGPPKDEKSGSGRSDSSYKEVTALCEELGAVVTPQVHKRVFAVICNKSAAMQSTQRVRKAMKRYLPLIDVEWLLKCKEEGQRVSYEEYSLTEIAREAEAGKNKKVPETRKEVHVQDESDEELLKSDIGWSEPVDVGCCCVCHDDDRDDCKWCIDCPVNRLKKNKK